MEISKCRTLKATGKAGVIDKQDSKHSLGTAGIQASDLGESQAAKKCGLELLFVFSFSSFAHLPMQMKAQLCF